MVEARTVRVAAQEDRGMANRLLGEGIRHKGSNNEKSSAAHRAVVLGLSLISGLVGLPAEAAMLGETIPEAIGVHLTRGGLDHLGGAVAAVVPPTIPIEASGGELSCGETDVVPLTWALDAMDLTLRVDSVELVPADGALEIVLYATLGSSASNLSVTGDCSLLTGLDESCAVELPTTAVEAHFGVQVTDSGDGLVTEALPSSLWISPVGNPLSGCSLGSAIGTMLAQDPMVISDLLTEAIEPSLDTLGPTLALSLDDALASLSLSTSVALLGANLNIDLAPSSLTVDEQGVFLGMEALVEPDFVSACVDSSGGSSLRGTGWPTLSETAGETGLPVDAALLLGADFLDHTLFAAWASGTLCLDAGSLLGAIAEDGLTAGLIGGAIGPDFQAMFPADTPASLIVTPAQPPRARFSDDDPVVHVDLEQLEVDLYSELDHRKVRALQATGSADIGVSVALSEAELVTGLVYEDPALRLTETYSELLGPGYSRGLEILFSSFIGSLIPADLLPTVAIPLPLGLGIESLTPVPLSEGAYQGLHLRLDTSEVTPIALSGCSLDGFGCDGSGLETDIDLESLLGCDAGLGCDGSTCAHGGTVPVRAARGRLGLLGLLVAGLFLRRRR